MVRSQISQSFVARIWLERDDDEDPKWRGHIQHIQGREEVYFQDLTEMCEFLEQVSGLPCMGFTAFAESNATTSRRGVTSNRKRKPEK